MNIYQKLVEIRKEVKSLKRDAQGFGYNYSSGSNVLSSIRDKMDELQVLLSPEIIEQHKEQCLVKVWNKELKSMVEKLEWVIELKVNYTWINAENPEDKYVVPFSGFGQQSDPAQAFGSALTYSERYFVLKELQIPTDDDDPDKKNNGKKELAGKGNKLDPCPLCKAKDKVIESKFPEKGKYYCLECKQSFDSFGDNENPPPPPKASKNEAETPRTSTQPENKGSSPQIAEKARIDFVNYAKKVFSDQMPTPFDERLAKLLLIADKTSDDQKKLLKWFSHYIEEGDKEKINKRLNDWSTGRGYKGFGIFEIDEDVLTDKEIAYAYNKAKKDFKAWVEGLDGVGEPPSLEEVANEANKTEKPD